MIFLCVIFSAMYSYSVSSTGGKMASASGKSNDGGVTMEQLEAVEYELNRNRMIEENMRRLVEVRKKSVALQEHIEQERRLAEAREPPKKKSKKVCSFQHI